MPLVMDKLDWLQGELVKAGNLTQPYDLGRWSTPRSARGAQARGM